MHLVPYTADVWNDTHVAGRRPRRREHTKEKPCVVLWGGAVFMSRVFVVWYIGCVHVLCVCLGGVHDGGVVPGPAAAALWPAAGQRQNYECPAGPIFFMER